MPSPYACLTCKHIAFQPTPGWKPSYDGDEFDHHDMRRVITETNLHQPGICTLKPKWREITTDHFCSQWAWFGGEFGKLRVKEFLWGSAELKQVRDLNGKVADLKKQLAHVRRVSASRLARLRKEKK